MATSPTGPALPPPPGVTPNFVDPPEVASRNAFLIGNIICLAVPTILVILRIYVKSQIVKELRSADYASVVAWALSVAFVAVALSMLRVGLDYDAWNVQAAVFVKYAERQNQHQIIYMPSILITKVSILLQLIEIFVAQKRNYRWYLLVGLIGANVAFFTILFFMEIFSCIPREKIWDPSVPGKCIAIQNTFVATGVINVVDDFIILLLPVYWVWLLQMSIKKKAGISLIFAAGLFACVCSIMRLLESIRDVGSKNITATLAPVTLWAVAEVSSGLLVGCLPTLPRLFIRPNANKGSTPTHTTNETSLKSKNKYMEMDDLSFPQLPSTVTDIESQRRHQNGQSHDRFAEEDNMQRPMIVKTVSINQSSVNGK